MKSERLNNMGKVLPDVECSICGLSSMDDKNFHKRAKLCNRHWLQIKRNGKPTDTMRYTKID